MIISLVQPVIVDDMNYCNVTFRRHEMTNEDWLMDWDAIGNYLNDRFVLVLMYSDVLLWWCGRLSIASNADHHQK